MAGVEIQVAVAMNFLVMVEAIRASQLVKPLVETLLIGRQIFMKIEVTGMAVAEVQVLVALVEMA